MGLSCISVKDELGYLGVSLIVVATRVQNAIAATATTTSTPAVG